MKLVLLSIFIFFVFIAGIFLGVRSGFESQMYYDAPNKIKILAYHLDRKESREEVLGQIITQTRILNEHDDLIFKNKFILNFFPDGELLTSQFNEYYPEVKNNIHYQEALKSLCRINEKYKNKCNENL